MTIRTLFLATYLLLSLFLVIPGFGLGREDPGKKKVVKMENSLLWQISGNGLEKPSFLYGTIHLICEQDMQFTPEIQASFASTDQLVLEINMMDPEFLIDIQRLMFMQDDKKLADLLGPDDYSKVKSFFSDSLGMDLQLMERVKPFFLQGMLYGQILGCQPEGYEQKFMEMASDANKNVLALETLQLQMELFDQIPYQKQAALLLEIIVDYEENKQEFFELVNTYKKQDIEGAYQLIKKADAGPESFEEALLTKRNMNWIPMIEEMAKDKPTFIAVGAGHLAGENGVINLLRQKGYQVKPVQ